MELAETETQTTENDTTKGCRQVEYEYDSEMLPHFMNLRQHNRSRGLMQTLNQACISYWEEANDPNPDVGESRQPESAQWPECIDSLSSMLANRNGAKSETEAPNPEAIVTAMRYLQVLRRQYPQAPPTVIVPELGGGIMVERRITSTEGEDVIVELTFYNNSTIESIVYGNGKVVHMEQSK